MGRPRGTGSCAIALEDLREGGVTIELSAVWDAPRRSVASRLHMVAPVCTASSSTMNRLGGLSTRESMDAYLKAGILNDIQPRYAAEWTPIMLSIEKSDRGQVLAGSRDRAASASRAAPRNPSRTALESQALPPRPPCMRSTSP
jgi:hypothetical protein